MQEKLAFVTVHRKAAKEAIQRLHIDTEPGEYREEGPHRLHRGIALNRQLLLQMAHRRGVKHLVSASWYSYYGGVSGFNF